MAERPPKTRADVQRVRSLDSRHLRSGAAGELLAAIEVGRPWRVVCSPVVQSLAACIPVAGRPQPECSAAVTPCP